MSERVATASRAVTVDDPELIESTRRLLNEIHKRAAVIGIRLKVETIANDSGLSRARVKAILYRSQDATQFSLEEIRKVITYARSYGESLKDEEFKASLLSQAGRLSRTVSRYIEKGNPDRLGDIDWFFLSQLHVDPGIQADFSKSHAGPYLLIRFNADGRLVLARMDISGSTTRTPVPRFRTRIRSRLKGQQIVEGYIYRFEHHVYAVGRISGTGSLRYTILEDIPDRNGDMMGLRLGISGWDKGPFAHALYCHNLGSGDHAQLEPLLTLSDDNDATIASVRTHVKDIDDIVELLRAACGDRGVRIPSELF